MIKHNAVLLIMLFLKLNVAFASYGLEPICGSNYADKPGTVKTVVTMPKVRSQDSLGVCYAFAVSAIVDQLICKYEKQNDPKAPKCEDMPLSKKMSVLDFSRFQSAVDNEERTYRQEFFGLHLDGGGAVWGLYHALIGGRTDTFGTEECSPFDQLLSKLKDPAAARAQELAMWDKIKKVYAKNTRSRCYAENDYVMPPPCDYSKEEKKVARDFSKELLDGFGMDVVEDVVQQAFNQRDYSRFLEYIFVPLHCLGPEHSLDMPPTVQMYRAPAKEEAGNYDYFAKTVKELNARDIPVGLTYCAQEPFTAKKIEDCYITRRIDGEVVKEKQGHMVVIKGFKTVCDKKNKCQDLVWAHNSWGQPWQDDNCDGWVKAKDLFERSFYKVQSLFWLEL